MRSVKIWRGSSRSAAWRMDLRRLRIGALGARPTAFNTVRYSEKLLEASGISVETLDLSEVFGRIERMKDDDPGATAKLESIKGYVSTSGIPPAALLKMAKLGAVIEDWMRAADLDISAIQCWTSMEEYFGVVPCTVMSMMSNNLLSSACEVDIAGVVGMHALRLASETPSALLDWNNNYGDDPNKAVCFHCSNLPKHFFETVKMDFQQIIAGTVGKENTYGTCVGRVKAGPMSYARFSTDDLHGRIRGYVGEGEFTKDPLETFGGAGVVRIPRLQDLLRHICETGYEHHVAANLSWVAGSVHEATTQVSGLGRDVAREGRSVDGARGRCRFRHPQRARFYLPSRERPLGRRHGRLPVAPHAGRPRPRHAKPLRPSARTGTGDPGRARVQLCERRGH